MTDLSDCQCIACRGRLAVVLPGGDADTIEGRFACLSCGKTYDQVWGAPFFLEYDDADFVGLIEIAANAGLVSPHSPEDLDHFYGLMERYHTTPDRAAFCEEAGPGYGPWLPVRYNEWVAVESLVGDETWAGRDILDVGAGLGFDSYRHVRAGARVTALEHSPVLAREGKRTLPMIRWLGGAAHMLPFADESFDAVFCNAALHHLRDVPTSISEMLRVLRPGGVLITTGDPFRADADGEESELVIFNAHAGVLMGINEQVPRFDAFVSALTAHREYIDPHIFTQVLYGVGREEEFREWDFDLDREMLSSRAGSLAMKVRLKTPIDRQAARRGPVPSVLRAATVAAWMEDQTHAMSKLAAWAPEDAVNRPFPGFKSSKFELLNGWQAPTGETWRQGYRRARWYLRRKPAETALDFELWSGDSQTFDILLNGALIETIKVLSKQWRPIRVDLLQTPAGVTFTLEVRRQGEPATFEAGTFRVRRRSFVGGVRRTSVSVGDVLQTWRARLSTVISELKHFVHQQLKARP